MAADFAAALAELGAPERATIEALGMLAMDSVDEEREIVSLVLERAALGEKDKRLAALYLADHLAKKCGHPWNALIGGGIADTFNLIYLDAGADERGKLRELLATWRGVFDDNAIFQMQQYTITIDFTLGTKRVPLQVPGISQPANRLIIENPGETILRFLPPSSDDFNAILQRAPTPTQITSYQIPEPIPNSKFYQRAPSADKSTYKSPEPQKDNRDFSKKPDVFFNQDGKIEAQTPNYGDYLYEKALPLTCGRCGMRFKDSKQQKSHQNIHSVESNLTERLNNLIKGDGKIFGDENKQPGQIYEEIIQKIPNELKLEQFYSIRRLRQYLSHTRGWYSTEDEWINVEQQELLQLYDKIDSEQLEKEQEQQIEKIRNNKNNKRQKSIGRESESDKYYGRLENEDESRNNEIIYDPTQSVCPVCNEELSKELNQEGGIWIYKDAIQANDPLHTSEDERKKIESIDMNIIYLNGSNSISAFQSQIPKLYHSQCWQMQKKKLLSRFPKKT
ncbi:MAG: hypothetical protein EZS28_002340 [Streblomastix strix]|uniref:C2H2-type domain-containing protein n=1 Tax=Streblomastix strix TaxID=222440 RepID=A0A5J4X4I3_9EUKA|nr:MAG: hypothetical protein EZS28_002340 [Streblomastix strix]